MHFLKRNAKFFFINIYNALVIHATVVLGQPKTALQRSRFFTRVSYEIGGNTFSLNDIEHGILRGNRKAPGKLKKQWNSNNPRAKFELNTFDQRIHFALVCGAKSCPPIRIYTEENIDKALTWAAEGFCSDEVVVEGNTVTMSKLFSWYKKDFGKNKIELLQSIGKFKSDDAVFLELLKNTSEVKIKFFDYDWDSNGRGNDGESISTASCTSESDTASFVNDNSGYSDDELLENRTKHRENK
eukprot:TRINITY_DN16254_c0_g1_i1.p1 TRINITY_DN16254_c0_g1~~TRINITY_DN16254_c0_g1_i1.p1  ORF type:complete len:242 (-),score=48.09 TRINITY_DN16254_c0_g1_i1:14-739(-)